MSKRRTLSLILSFVLAFAVTAPQAALGNRAPEEPAAVATTTTATASAEAPDADESEAGADDAQQPKRKGNAFARALSAPFRALARLFGGGRKPETAKKPAPQSTQETASAQGSTQNEVKQEAAADGSQAAKGDAAPAVSEAARTRIQEVAQAKSLETPKVEPLSTPAAPSVEAAQAANGPAGVAPLSGTVAVAPAPEGVRIVRPSGVEVAQELRPKMWIPLIVGVPADSVSQGRALLQHGYIQEAIAELQVAATTVGPQLAEANNLLGLAYDRLGWHRQAVAAYERALTVSPKDYVILANLGYSLYLDDNYAGALRRLNQAARLAPVEPVVFNNLGVVNARLGRYGDAYKNFAKASNEYDAHVKLAGILEEQHRDKDAVKHYEAALRLQPGASAVLERLVALYERTGARDKADTARRALGQPKNPQKTATGGGG